MSTLAVPQPRRGRTATSATITLLSALALFLVWTFATYWFEGRIGLLLHPTLLGRWIYVLIANIAVGTLAVGWLAHRWVTAGLTTPAQLGFQGVVRSLIAIVLAGVVGFGLFVLQRPVSLEPLVLLNGFAQAIQTSIAEVLVCWVIVGGSVEALLRPKGRVLAIVLALVAADVLFGFYHYAHSAPFNQLSTVLFLMIPGLVTSLVYFLGRDIYAAILIQNFLGMIGVMRNIDLTLFRQPLYPLYALTLLSILALVAVHWLMLRPASPPRA
jgi:hypothetical protein